MNRKDFLSAVVPLAVVIPEVVQNKKVQYDPANTIKVPHYLKKGDMIGVCCPSGFLSLEDVQPAVNKMQEWGFKVRIGSSVGAKDFTYGGTDEERIEDLQCMLDDPSLKAIMFGRGGYGAIRIIDKIDFRKFELNPKWIIGFSDATVFHSHINKNFGIASIHSKMCNSFPKDWTIAEPTQIESIESIRKCLIGEKMEYNCPVSQDNRTGTAEGILIGGNLAIIETLSATASDINTNGKILFLEEVEEYLYSLDRMLWNLKRSGKFDKLKALIIGGFNKIKPDDPGEEFGSTVFEMVLEKVKEFKYPVCFDFPVGHQKFNMALKCGIKHRLIVSDDVVRLEEVQ